MEPILGKGSETGKKLGARKMKKRRGRGREGKRGRESPGNLLYKKFFSTICFSELLLASFLIKFKMRPMKSDHTLIWK